MCHIGIQVHRLGSTVAAAEFFKVYSREPEKEARRCMYLFGSGAPLALDTIHLSYYQYAT